MLYSIRGKKMNTTISGRDLKCPCCGKRLAISFDHTMNDKHLDEIQDSVYFKKVMVIKNG